VGRGADGEVTFLNSGEGLFVLKGRNKDGRLFIQNSHFLIF
jgi:hypothetical protein